MTGLAERLTPTSRRCTFVKVRDLLDDEDRTVLDMAVEQTRTYRQSKTSSTHNQFSTFSAAAIHRALVAHGVEVGLDAVVDHVYGRCAC